MVTGTAISGRVRVGDLIEVYPPQFKARVRNIQVHDENVEEALAGSRTAINLQGIDKLDLERGMVVATPEALLDSPEVGRPFGYLAQRNTAAKKPAGSPAAYRDERGISHHNFIIPG